MLVDGCNVVSRHSSQLWNFLSLNSQMQHGVGNWKAILSNSNLKFDSCSPVDLKDRQVNFISDSQPF
jgi:hypothetical protein